ncbi:Ran binding domain [Arabidopsis suecica]|uniref:Ran binding domain n=1 Tax=Arabidopsis suecica TaxID=45249 RepID=A0A8T2H0S6_ARASU|nr:Ran binding domain [Arabidopsis suecica]
MSSSSWVRGACIGRGCFGAVSTAISKTNGEVFAVKSVDLTTCLPTQSESLENEISVLCSLKPHPYVVKFLGDGVSKEGTTTFRNLYLEYLPEGDVANYTAGGINDETLLQRYTACLVSALRHVHSQGFVHCDVKARNVLVSQSSMFKLADFGSAFRIHTPTAQITPRGSPLWMAPEVIRREYQGPESDVWSLGCTIIEMFTGKPAWEDHGIIDSLSRIGFSDELPVFPSKLSEIGRDFLEKCLKRDPNQRWSCDQLLQHPFLSQCHNSSPTESSPRCVLDWVNSGFDLEEEEEEEVGRSEFEDAAMARICNLATTGRAIWESDGWVEVRCHASEEEGTTMEYSGSTRVVSEYNTSSDPYDDMAGDWAIIDVYVSPNTPPGNEGSAAALLPYELVMYHRDNNNNKLETLSFNHSLKFCLFAHVLRIRQNYLLRASIQRGISRSNFLCCKTPKFSLSHTPHRSEQLNPRGNLSNTMATNEPEHEHRDEEEAGANEDEDTGAQVAPIVRLEEVAVTTGEEDEDAVLDLKSKLYRFDKDANQWKERGAGTVKLLKHKNTGKIRLVMRQSKTLKICANHFVKSGMSVQEHVGNEKSCVWHARDFADGELKDELFCIRFASIENCKTFMQKFKEVADSEEEKEESKDASDTAGLLEKLTVEETKTEEKTESKAVETAKTEVKAEEKKESEAEKSGEEKKIEETGPST